MVVVEEKAVKKMEIDKEEPHVILQNLTRAELTLIKEKKKLEVAKAKLTSEVNKKIDGKMSNIQKLRDEIANLKFSCDELSKSLSMKEK